MRMLGIETMQEGLAAQLVLEFIVLVGLELILVKIFLTILTSPLSSRLENIPD